MINVARRSLFKGSLAWLAAAATRSGASGNATDAARAALTDPANVHQVYRRMRFAEHEQVFFWWLRGVRSGLIDNQLTPLFRMEVGSLHRCHELGEGRYSVTSLGLVYYTDLHSGDLLQRWHNPLTDAMVPIQYAAPKPTTVVYSGAGIESEPAFAGAGATRTRELGPVDVVGADVWLNDSSHLNAPPQSGANTPLHVNDLYTLHSPLQELLNLRQRFVPCFAVFNDFNTWSPRLQMGDRAGTSLSRCNGRKEARLDALPASYLALGQRLHPDIFANPAAALAR